MIYVLRGSLREREYEMQSPCSFSLPRGSPSAE